MSNLKNLVPCCIKVFKQKPDNEGYYIEPTKNQMIDKLLEQHEKLTKYKRAFEILKEVFDIRFEKDEDGDCWIKIFPKTYDDRHILGEPTNEQYELLEELMK